MWSEQLQSTADAAYRHANQQCLWDVQSSGSAHIRVALGAPACRPNLMAGRQLSVINKQHDNSN